MFNFKIKCLALICLVVYHHQSYASSSSSLPLEGSDQAKQSAPFWVSAELPVMTGLGLPKAMSTQLPNQGDVSAVINGIVKSNANDAGVDGESLILDGESQAWELGLEYGLSERWSFGLQVAYIKHTAGSLDGLIQGWHSAFGLSDGDRPLFEEDDLNFNYRQGSEQRQINQPTSGLSDTRIGLAYAIKQSSDINDAVENLTLRSGLNLPTGDAENLTGSDKLDWDIGLYTSGRSNKWQGLGWHANFGYLYIGDDSLFGIATNQHAWFNSLGVSWRMSPKTLIKSQIDSHSAVFDSGIDEIAQYASQLTLGMSYATDALGLVELYVSEDLTVNRAADFSLGLSFRFSL